MSSPPAFVPRRVVLTFNPDFDEARSFAVDLAASIEARGVSTMVADEGLTPDEVSGGELVVCLGGDGSLLHCARTVMGTEAVILGINFGRLGFLSELNAEEVNGRLDEVLAGGGRIEERTMLQAEVPGRGGVFHGLNEAVVGRATLSRAIQLAVDVGGTRIADYRCDGVIVASATGSTAYALSVGGPILHPDASDLVLVPVAPHLSAQHAVVLPGNEKIHITLEQRQQAVLSVDGLADVELNEGDSVLVGASDYKARFLRLNSGAAFYRRMATQLGWHRPGGNATPLPAANSPGGAGA